jgi:putative phosphoribosyl transferase
MRFKDRHAAALELIPYLDKYRNESGIILAVPRGGVPIAYPIAKSLNLPLELLMTKKIGHPANKEFAIGAVSLQDHIVDDTFSIPQYYIDAEIQNIRESLKEKYRKFAGKREPTDLENKTVIIIDDGIATGNTILSSIKMLRQQKPKKLVIAVPVAPADTVSKLKEQVDDIVCLYTPDPFLGVGLHYVDFSQVSDEEVIRMMRDINHIESV